jgi:hypothetical protein
MLNVHDQQFYKIQLKWAADNFDAEHRMRLAAEQRAAGARGLLMDVVVHLLASELDDVRKQEDVALWTDAQLVLWMKDQLSRQLRQLRAVAGAGAQRRFEQAAQEIRRLQADNAQLNEEVRASAQRAVGYEIALSELRQQNERLQQALADARDDLDRARSQAARQAVPSPPPPPPVISDMPSVDEPVVSAVPTRPASSTSAPDWYDAWRSAMTTSAFERQQRIIETIGRGEAFFRAEIVAALNAADLLRDDPDRPSGTLHRLFAALSEHALIAEIDGGYGASVARPIVLTERGREAYRLLTGQTLPESLYQRLLKRHKTVEHTVLNLMARQVLHRFAYTAIDLFPAVLRTAQGAAVIPDLTAVSPEGERLLIECERLAKHRTPAERRNKWGDLAELTQGQLHVIVPGNHQQRDLITEISQWLMETGTKRARLSICQYAQALKPEAVRLWTYTTEWALA